MKTVGDRIKELRQREGLSQVEFASKVGVSKQTLYKYENNIITNIPSDKIEQIAEKFNMSPAALMGWDEPPEVYYLNDDARDAAEFLLHHPEYKVLFDASRKVKKEDIDLVAAMLERMNH